MKANQSYSHGKWRSAARKLVCGVAAAGMAVALVPAAAFGEDQLSDYYPLPTADSAVSFEHTATGNGHEYTYRYVTVGGSATGRVAPMMQTWYEALGLNYTDAYRGTKVAV